MTPRDTGQGAGSATSEDKVSVPRPPRSSPGFTSSVSSPSLTLGSLPPLGHPFSHQTGIQPHNPERWSFGFPSFPGFTNNQEEGAALARGSAEDSEAVPGREEARSSWAQSWRRNAARAIKPARFHPGLGNSLGHRSGISVTPRHPQSSRAPWKTGKLLKEVIKGSVKFCYSQISWRVPLSPAQRAGPADSLPQ